MGNGGRWNDKVGENRREYTQWDRRRDGLKTEESE